MTRQSTYGFDLLYCHSSKGTDNSNFTFASLYIHDKQCGWSWGRALDMKQSVWWVVGKGPGSLNNQCAGRWGRGLDVKQSVVGGPSEFVLVGGPSEFVLVLGGPEREPVWCKHTEVPQRC